MSSLLHKEYYKPGRYFRPSKGAPGKLAKLAGVTEKEAFEWLMKQPIYQIYLPAPKTINRPNDSHSDYLKINSIHEADILYLPHDDGYKYVLALVDVATRFKAAYPLKTKTSKEVTKAFKSIYDESNGILKPPLQLSVDKGTEFFKETTTYFKSEGTKIYRSHELTHIVERFNETLAKHLFGIQYYKEMLTGSTNREWVKDLPKVLEEINNTKTRLIGNGDLSPNEAVRVTNNNGLIYQGKSSNDNNNNNSYKPIEIDSTVRYLLRDGEDFNTNTRRATDPIWSTDLYIVESVKDKIPPTYYYLEGIPNRHFLREELQLIKYIDD